MEQAVQITVIITFITSTIVFFIKLGEYKSIINSDIETLKKDVDELKKNIEEMEDELKNMKSETNKITSNLEAMLIEIRTKLELLIQYSGMFNGSENNKK